MNIDPVTQNVIQLGISIIELPEEQGNLPGFIIQPLVPNSLSLNFPINDRLNIEASSVVELESIFGVLIRPDEIKIKYPFDQLGTHPKGRFFIKLKHSDDFPFKFIELGNNSGIDIIGFESFFQIENINDQLEILLGVNISQLKFTLDLSKGDEFISNISNKKLIEINTFLSILWSSARGIHFQGGGGLKLSQPVNLEAGFIQVSSIDFLISSMDEVPGKISASLAATIKLRQGPFSMTIEGLGIENSYNLEKGNIGPLGIDLAFSSPKGIALQIDAKGAKGGGYLFFDPAQERYAGAIELQLGKGKKKILVKAIGVLTTKLPNNEDGYSLLVLVNAEFNPSIKLGMGFSLSGIGGLVGLHRSMNLPAFRAGVRNNSLSSILFPQDPLQQINRIITDLEQFFPVQEKRHSFGLMAKLAWGPSKLMTMDVGILLELPKPVRVALIGVLKGILPTEDKPILVLQVNFAGTWDQERKYITFDASLYNSKLLAFPLVGDMALRILYGDEPNFLLSVGGFHPAFEVPPLDLPIMHRLTISLLKGEKPRLILSAYFALTSNTVQVGASIEFYFEILKKYALIGFLGFDALFQFSPFYFNVNFQALLALKNIKKNKSLFAIALGLNLEGPTPWHAKGYASFTIVGIPIKANIDKTFGKKENTILPDVAVLPKLKGELENLTNWETVLPADKELQVTLRKTDGELAAHPYGVLSVTQKIVPLRFQMNKYGHQRPADYQKFDIGLDIGGTGPATSYLKEHFPPADFQNMSDAEKLSRKSFEKFDAGLEMVGHQEMKMSFFRQRACEYETVIMTNRYEPQAVGKQPEDALRFGQLQKGSASYQSPRSLRYRGGTSGPRVKIKQASFHVVRKDNLETVQGFSAASQAEARQLLLEAIELDPSLEGSIQVVPARLAV